MAKKIVFLAIIALVLVSMFGFISAADDSGIGGLPGQEDIEKAREAIGEAQEAVEQKKWEYLGEQWKTLFLKNKYVSAVHGFLQKIDFIFVFLFGEHYDLSLLLLFVVVLWFFFLFNFKTIFSDFMPLSKNVALVMAVAFNIIAAQLGIFRIVANGLFKLMFYKSGIWPWISTLVIIVGLVVLFMLVKSFAKVAKAKREAGAKAREKLDREVIHETAKGILGGEKNIIEQ